MASDLNRIILIGRFVKDPELRYTQNGKSVTNFSVANNRSYTVGTDKKEYTSFFSCIAWGKLGELIVQYCKKGNRIAIEGRLQQRSWDDQDGKRRSAVEIVVENFQFLTSKQDKDAMTPDIPGPSDMGPGSNIDDHPFSDNEVPF
ncbi:MAG TPA: single-stranded DNA-binding protein [Spirochaetota bacterium]|nr:single-stranded DNA-binding protein [Spirochaetota bacterium]HNT09575.1 single-stranded DNA-binding protein [Spirochaetota bacterium]HNV45619.1 single-stranded DNA-binding protein [Spirochaetota bacterium]HOS38948.1 single-stranded DNA-binding protein [Spirochaetota bacterium]HPI22549.1 single-stranded DNA-binding protein [Spirochaetota bacterium]